MCRPVAVELDYPVDISEVSRLMENLLLESADKLLRYTKGMLWIDLANPTACCSGRAASLYSADWDRPWGNDENAAQHAGIYRGSVAEDEIKNAAFCGVKEVTIKALIWLAGICRPDKARPPSGIFGLFLILLAQLASRRMALSARLVACGPFQPPITSASAYAPGLSF